MRFLALLNPLYAGSGPVAASMKLLRAEKRPPQSAAPTVAVSAILHEHGPDAAVTRTNCCPTIALVGLPAAKQAWRPERPSSEPAGPPRRCLPCAAWSRFGRVRRFRPAAASFSRGRLPGAPSRGRDGKSWRAPCGLLQGSG